jgi:putative spermidine/putrescine transport system ATP-binding protein
MTDVVFSQVSKRFGETQALIDFDLTVQAGELVCLLGPSGCGKTTALRILAGFESPDTGDVRVAGASVVHVDAHHRGFGMVFQSYSLFPNMTARRNIGFACEMRGVKGANQRSRVDALLELTGLGVHADKYPHQMSGGQQQRVALARALATEPPVLLLDEPLSALDAAVREQLRDEIRRLQQETGITTVFVTHDQHEAMAISDRIGVMNGGTLVQLAPPPEVYAHPVDSFVSTFLGTSNRVPVMSADNGTLTVLGREVIGIDPSDRFVHVRPEHIRLLRDASSGDGVPARVRSVSFLGPLTRASCSVDDIDVLLDLPSVAADGLAVDELVRVVLDGPVTLADH